MKQAVIARFGTFEVDFDSGEIRKAGFRIRVQQQPFKVLVALLEQPGAVVTREELRARIWPTASFGDFDQAVNVAVAKLRIALGDSAENPRFIQTVPRRGYRFVAPVQREGVAVEMSASPAASESPAWNIAEPPRSHQRPRSDYRTNVVMAALALILIAVAYLIFRPNQLNLEFRRITYSRGYIRSARFGPDGSSVVFGGAWNGNSPQLFWTQPGTPDARSYPLPDADILAVSKQGQLAILLNRRAGVLLVSHGTLALMPITGGAPREVLDDVQDADWDRDAEKLAVVHWVGDHCRLEYPIGTALYDASGGHWLSNIRVSPRDNLIAFMDHPLEGDDAGTLQVVDFAGHRRALTSSWVSLGALAWDASGNIWFSGNELVAGRLRSRAIYQVDMAGKQKEMFHESGDLTLHDLSPDGRLLVTRDVERYEAIGVFDGVRSDLSWLDFSRVDDLSADGDTVLMTVEGSAASTDYNVYLRKTDGSAPVRLGEGYGAAISPDGKSVLAVAPFGTKSNAGPQFTLLPVGPGEPKFLTNDSISHTFGAWFPDGQRIVFRGSDPGHAARAWIQPVSGGHPTPVTPEGTSGTQLSPDGKLLCARDTEGEFWIYSLDGGSPQRIKGIAGDDRPIRWSKDGKSIFVAKADRLPVQVLRVDLASGHRDLAQELMPRDPAGVIPDISFTFATPDGRDYVYSYFRLQSDLYVASRR